MKFKIQGNSIRVRFTQGEVARLRDGQTLTQSTDFSATEKLIVLVEPALLAAPAVAAFDGKTIRVQIQRQAIRRWADSDQVGIEAEQRIDGDRHLKILIEKDFECLHQPAASEEDAFPNPLKR